MNKLKKLFLTELADRYDPEKRLVPAMANVVKAATCKHLEKLIKFHLNQTERHVKQLERVFKSFDEKVKSRKCEATIGLLREGAESAGDFKKHPPLRPRWFPSRIKSSITKSPRMVACARGRSCWGTRKLPVFYRAFLKRRRLPMRRSLSWHITTAT